MKVAVFGATGGTGHSVVGQALAKGNSVQALVRTPAKLTVTHPDLIVIEGNVLDADKVEASLKGVDAVVVSLGNTDNNPEMIVSKGTRVIIDEMQKQGIRRLVVVSSLGVGDSIKQVPFFFRALMKTVLKSAMQDKEVQEEMVRESGLDWIIVRPGGLTDGPGTGSYTAGLDGSIGAGQVSRADVADFIVKQLVDNTYLHQTPAIT